MQLTQSEANFLQAIYRKPGALENAIVFLYNCQTADEKASGSTKAENGKGFSMTDVRRGTYLAKWAMKGQRFTRHHRKNAEKLARKYRKQLMVEAARRTASKVEPQQVEVQQAEAPKQVSQSMEIAAETQAIFNAESLKAKVASLPKKQEPKQIDLRFSMLELD